MNCGGLHHCDCLVTLQGFSPLSPSSCASLVIALCRYTNLGLFGFENVGRGDAWLTLAAPRLDYELVTSYTLMIRVTDDGQGGVEARIPPTLFDQQTVTIFVSNEQDTPEIYQVTGGSSFGLSTSGGEPLTIYGRFFGSSRPGSLNGGLPWVATNGSQANMQVRLFAT